MVNFKMQKELSMGKDATYNLGLRDSSEMEMWHSAWNSWMTGAILLNQNQKLGCLDCINMLNSCGRPNRFFIID